MLKNPDQIGDAAAGLGLHFLHMSEGPFSHNVGQINLHAYCPSHVHVQTNFWRYFCYIALNQAHTHLDHLKV